MKKAKILGVKVDHVTMEQAISRIVEMVAQPKPHLIVTANSEMVMMANDDPLLYEIIERADLVVPDGIGVIWASRLLNNALPQRVPGVELMQSLVAESAVHQWRIFLLGAEPGIADQAAQAIQAAYPAVNIVGTHHGYFKQNHTEQHVLSLIKASKPDILFIALGVPKQEKWAAAHLAKLGVPVAIGVGGSFQIFAGTVQRAPLWMRRVGLEWFYRLLKQPWRIKRMSVLPRFVFWVLFEKIFQGEIKQ